MTPPEKSGLEGCTHGGMVETDEGIDYRREEAPSRGFCVEDEREWPGRVESYL